MGYSNAHYAQLSSYSKCDHVGLLCCDRREAYALRLRDAVLAPQVAVGFHCQRAAVFVSEPAGDGRNVHAAFDAARCEQVPQIVMRDAIRADFLHARSSAFWHSPTRKTFASNGSPGRSPRIRSNSARASGISGTAAHCPILCGRFGVAAHNDLASFKVHVAPCRSDSASPFRQPVNANPRTKSAQSREHHAPACSTASTSLQELVTARQRELLRAHWHALQAFPPGCCI